MRTSASSRRCKPRRGTVVGLVPDRRPRPARHIAAQRGATAYDGAMVSGLELAQAFAAAWTAQTEVGDELTAALVALCAAAHRELPELDDAIDDRALVGALAARAPERDVVAYLERCHPVQLALAQAASRGHPAAIAMIERDFRSMLDALCWRYTSPGHSVADLRQILREKLYVGPPDGNPKLADYAGHGELASWLRVTAVRALLDLGKRKDRAREAPHHDAALAMPDPGDLSLEVIKAEYRQVVAEAMREAAAQLDLADRHLLHQHFVAGLSIDELGVALGIHRATAARRVARAREAYVGDVRAVLATRLRLPPGELDDVIGMVLSRLDVSIPRLLTPDGP
jgi:RNA polymerase sigma-70 factor (ECF subfamily)